MDVCLVNMPYVTLSVPSLALGLLHAALERENLSARSVYANLRFADLISARLYGLIMLLYHFGRLGDWTFAHLAFPDGRRSETEYLRLLREECSLDLADQFPGGFNPTMLEVREKAGRLLDALTEDILSCGPRVVGCSSTFEQTVPSLALLRRIHENAPKVVTMMGGGNCEAGMGRALHQYFPWVDYVVSGDGDDLIAGLVRSVREAGREVQPESLPEGVFAPVHRRLGYPRRAGVCEDAPRAFVSSLDHLPIPNFDPYFDAFRRLPELNSVLTPGLIFESSRGCWWQKRQGCDFCGLNGTRRSFRSKPASQVLHELEVLSNRYGIRDFMTTDSIMDMRYYRTLLPRLKEAGRPYTFLFESTSLLQRSHVKALAEAGATRIQPGIESLDSRILKLMHKGGQAWRNVLVLKWCLEYGIKVAWNLLCEVPGERDEWYVDMSRMLPLLVHLPPPTSMMPIQYPRYSRYTRFSERFGLRLRPSSFLRYVYPLPEERLADLAPLWEDERRRELRRNPVLATLLAGPGLRTIERQVIDWLALWKGKERPELSMSPESDSLVFRDTRPISGGPGFAVDGLEREVYLACEDGVLESRIGRGFRKKGRTQEELRTAIQNLVDRKVLLAFEGRLLGLATRTTRN